MSTRMIERQQWLKSRFGNIDETILGEIRSPQEIYWPNLTKEYDLDEYKITFCLIEDITKWAARIAEIYTNGVDEMVGNCENEWHHQPYEIIERVKMGDWKFVGIFIDQTLIGALSLHIIRGQRSMQAVWGAIDPIHRGKKAWKYIGEFVDLVAEASGVEMLFVWVVTTHKLSQMTFERAGLRPMGLFVGGEFFGGSDNRYYRQNVVYYGKLYESGRKHLQNWKSMQLTEEAQKLAETICELWSDTSQVKVA